ncbi:MAG: hypothetical protein ACK55Z_00995 [bacterium]
MSVKCRVSAHGVYWVEGNKPTLLSSYSIEPFRDHIVPHVVLKIVPDFHTWFPRLFQISPLL